VSPRNPRKEVELHPRESEPAEVTQALEGSVERLRREPFVAGDLEDVGRERESRLNSLRVVDCTQHLEGRLRVGQRAIGIVPSKPDQTPEAVGNGRLVVLTSLLHLGDRHLGSGERLVPKSRVVRKQTDLRSSSDPPRIAVMAVIIGEPEHLVEARPRVAQPSERDIHRAKVVDAAQQIGDRVRGTRDLDALGQVVQASRVPSRHSCRADVVQRMRAEIVESELLRESQRLAPVLDGGIVLVTEHLVPRELAQNGDLNARSR
jgi:hypothetical protein